jgi:hypothetical protein
VLYLPRLAVLVTIVADRPGACFSGPLGPYQAWFPGICLSRDFKHEKVPVNPMKTPFCFVSFLGGHVQKYYFGVMREWPVQSTKVQLSLTKITARRPQGRALQSFFGPNLAPDFVFFPLTGISARGPQGLSDTALRPDSIFLAPYQAWFPAICLISEGETTKNKSCCAPLIWYSAKLRPVLNECLE